MPRNLKRYHESKQSHFITFSCYHREPRFSSRGSYETFVSSLESTRTAYGMLVYGYVVMPEHVHLLVSEPQRANLATAIQALKVSVAKLVPTRAPNTGARALGTTPFWQKRYYDHNVRSYEKFVEKLRYMHRNPVTRGLCSRPEDWLWSSFRHYALREVGVVEIESEWTARRRNVPLRVSPP